MRQIVISMMAGGALSTLLALGSGLCAPGNLLPQPFPAVRTPMATLIRPLSEAPPRFVFEFAPRGSGPGQTIGPSGLAVDAAGRVYAVDAGNHVLVFDVTNNSPTVLTAFGQNGSGPGQFNGPRDIAVDDQSNIYVADSFNHRIEVFTAAGKLLHEFWAYYGFGILTGLDVKNGQMFVLDAGNNEVRIFDLFGQPPLGQRDRFPVPYPGDAGSLAVDAQGNIYVVSHRAAKVTKYDWQGRWVLEWGSPGSDPGQFAEPHAIEADAAGNVYVADYNNYRVQKFDAEGHLLTLWGSHGSAPGQFEYIGALGAGPNGRLYVGQDSGIDGQPTIQVFEPGVGVAPVTWTDVKEKYR
jgi:tripartite motif-containing protein 71